MNKPVLRSAASGNKGKMAETADNNKDKKAEISTDMGKDDCGKCELTVSNGEKAVACDVCEVWFHIQCEDIPEEVYDFMMQEDRTDQLSWCCSCCKRGCLKLQQRMNKLEKGQLSILERQDNLEVKICEVKAEAEENQAKHIELENRVAIMEAKSLESNDKMEKNKAVNENLGDRLGSLEAKVLDVEEKLKVGICYNRQGSQDNRQGVSSDGGGAPKPVVNEQGIRGSLYKEINDMRDRENNFVVYGAPESTSKVIGEKISYDKNFVKNLMQACDVEQDATDKIFVFRLGKPAQGKSRPLLVRQRDSKVKRELFQNIRKLQGNKTYEKVRISHDLSKREREAEMELWNKAKNLQSAGKGRHTVVGPPWRRRIVKAREPQDTPEAGRREETPDNARNNNKVQNLQTGHGGSSSTEGVSKPQEETVNQDQGPPLGMTST